MQANWIGKSRGMDIRMKRVSCGGQGGLLVRRRCWRLDRLDRLGRPRRLPWMRGRVQIERLHLGACPGSLAQELERRVHAGIVREAADLDAIAETVPSVSLDEMLDHRLERDAVQGIDGTRLIHRLGHRRGQHVGWGDGMTVKSSRREAPAGAIPRGDLPP